MKFSDMPLRDFLAMEALPGAAAGIADPASIAARCYDIADAMLAIAQTNIEKHDKVVYDLTMRAQRAEATAELLRIGYGKPVIDRHGWWAWRGQEWTKATAADIPRLVNLIERLRRS